MSPVPSAYSAHGQPHAARRITELRDKLVRRIRVRPLPGDRRVCVLDLRHRQLGLLGIITLRAPGALGWPGRGATTDDPAVAADWALDYAEWLLPQIDYRQLHPGVPLWTVEEATAAHLTHRAGVLLEPHRQALAAVGVSVEAAVRACVAELLHGAGRVDAASKRLFVTPTGRDARAVVREVLLSFASLMRTHVFPGLGKRPLATITGPDMRALLDGARARPRGTGAARVRPGPATLKAGTQKRIRGAMTALWGHSFPDEPCPYRHVRVRSDGRAASEARWKIREGAFAALLQPRSGALTAAEIARVLAVATWYDSAILRGRGAAAALAVPNTAPAIALQIGLGLRVSELRHLRWLHIFEEEGYVQVPGTKTRAAARAVPLQRQVVPWLDHLRAVEGVAITARAFVIRTNGRGAVTDRAALNTLMHRYTRVLELAELKREGKATHWARATFATHAERAAGVRSEVIQRYLGHASGWTGETGRYIETIVAEMDPSHRDIMRMLPSPEQARAAAEALDGDALAERLAEIVRARQPNANAARRRKSDAARLARADARPEDGEGR